MFSEITELKSLREQKKKIICRERELAVPFITDWGMLPRIYGWFREILANRDFSPPADGITQRKEFIFIVLYLFAPAVLAGDRMPVGLRDKIAAAINLRDITFISHNIDTVVFLHRYDKAFRADIEYIYTEILKRLTGQRAADPAYVMDGVM